jgi:choline dehydrogenase-like flavoprotein
MGANPRTSVVDAEHRVWGVKGLYVADASIFPSASGVHPMLTVMGIAHRAAGAIASHV